jgi:glycosyltransferase involved in cell wall biosynthesis
MYVFTDSHTIGILPHSLQVRLMRVLVIAACPFPWPRGTPVRIHRLSEALVSLGHEVEVLTYHLGDQSIVTPFTVTRIPSLTRYSKTSPGPSLTKLMLLDPLLIRLVLKRCKEVAFDLIHAHHIEGLMIAQAAGLLGIKLPVVYDAHTQVGEELASYGPALASGIRQRMGHWLDTRLPAKANHVITVTEGLRNLFISRAGLRADEVTTVINGVEPDFIESALCARREIETFATQVQSNKDSTPEAFVPEIVFAGNLSAYQGINWLLLAFARVLQSKPQARLLLLTDDDFSPYVEQALQLRIARSLEVRPVPFTALPEALVRAGVLVNPRTECSGIPQKLLNYMASGTPIVSFRGSAKLVEHGKTALVVADEDVQGFAEAILTLLDSPALSAELGQRAQFEVEKHYSWKASAEKVEQVYHQLLDGKQQVELS